MDVFAPGSKVKIEGADDAVITAVSISAGGFVRYEVVWWNGNSRSTAWLESFEVVAVRGTKNLPVGFAS